MLYGDEITLSGLPATATPSSGGLLSAWKRRICYGLRMTDDLPLTDREKEVLQHCADGEQVGEIARGLHVEANTVKSHLKKIYRKLGVHTMAAAVAKALRRGSIN